MAQRRVAARSGLRIELGDRRRVLLALDLDVGVVGRWRLELLKCVFVGHFHVSLGGRPAPRRAAALTAYFRFSLSTIVCVCDTGGPPRADWNLNVAVTRTPLPSLRA